MRPVTWWAACGVAACGVAACSGLPPLIPIGTRNRPVVARRCLLPFPSGRFRAVHTIRATWPLGRRDSMIGVTVGDRQSRRLRSVLVSVEGLTFFDASYHDGKITVHRALPPLDHGDFGWGLFRDVAMIFLPPRGRPAGVGRLKDGRHACRWRAKGKVIVEVALEPRRGWRIRQYSTRGAVLREVAARSPTASGFAAELKLTAHGLGAYTLRMRLLRSSRISEKKLIHRR